MPTTTQQRRRHWRQLQLLPSVELGRIAGKVRLGSHHLKCLCPPPPFDTKLHGLASSVASTSSPPFMFILNSFFRPSFSWEKRILFSFLPPSSFFLQSALPRPRRQFQPGRGKGRKERGGNFLPFLFKTHLPLCLFPSSLSLYFPHIGAR